MYIHTIFYLPVVNSYWQPVVNSDFAIDNRLSIASSFLKIYVTGQTEMKKAKSWWESQKNLEKLVKCNYSPCPIWLPLEVPGLH